MHEQSIRVPATVWSPGRILGGRRIDDLTLLFDFGLTIFELPGLQPPR